MAIKKIIFKDLNREAGGIIAIKGVRVYNENNIIISSGSIIKNTDVLGETENFIATATYSYPNSSYNVIHSFNTNQEQKTDLYWGVHSGSSGRGCQTLTLEFKNKVPEISKITFIPRPGDASETDNFIVEIYDENNKNIINYNIVPIKEINSIQTLETPELLLTAPKFLIKQDGKYYNINNNYQELGVPKDNTQLENWYDIYGANDISMITQTLNNKKIPMIKDDITTEWKCKLNANDIKDNIEEIDIDETHKTIQYNCINSYNIFDLLNNEFDIQLDISSE